MDWPSLPPRRGRRRRIRVQDPEAVRIRTRRPGDRIRLKVGSKKLKDIFIDGKIERLKQGSLSAAEEDGEIIWVRP